MSAGRRPPERGAIILASGARLDKPPVDAAGAAPYHPRARRSGEIGIRTRLKIWRGSLPMSVRVRPPALNLPERLIRVLPEARLSGSRSAQRPRHFTAFRAGRQEVFHSLWKTCGQPARGRVSDFRHSGRLTRPRPEKSGSPSHNRGLWGNNFVLSRCGATEGGADYLLFLPAKVSVCEWQLGQRSLRFSTLWSKCTPLM